MSDQLTLYLGGKEIQFLHLGNAHTAGDLIMWLPQQKIVATGDVVTAPIPLMPSPYTNEYVEVLSRIKALGWEPKYDLKGLVEDMMAADLALFKKDLHLEQGGFKTLNYFE